MSVNDRLLNVVRSFKRKPASTKADGLSRLLADFRRKDSPKSKYWDIYKSDPIVAGGINMLAFRIVVDGAVVRAEDPNVSDELTQALRDIFPYRNQVTLVRDVFVFGDAWAEIVQTAGGGLHEVSPRNPEDFTIKDDEYVYFNGKDTVVVDESKFLHLQLFEDAESVGKGIALIQFIKKVSTDRREIYDNLVKAIERHGSLKWHVKVAPDSSKRYPDDEQMAGIAADFRDINARTEIASTDQYTITSLDTGGVPNVKDYQEFLLNEVSSGMLIPLEALGMGMRGVTHATTHDRLKEVFRYTIRAYRTIVADEMTKQLMPLLAPGSDARIRFEGIADDDIAETVEWLSKLMPATDPTLVFTVDEIREMLGFPNREDEEEPSTGVMPEQTPPTEEVEESAKADGEAFEKFQRGFERLKRTVKKEVFETVEEGKL